MTEAAGDEVELGEITCEKCGAVLRPDVLPQYRESDLGLLPVTKLAEELRMSKREVLAMLRRDKVPLIHGSARHQFVRRADFEEWQERKISESARRAAAFGRPGRTAGRQPDA